MHPDMAWPGDASIKNDTADFQKQQHCMPLVSDNILLTKYSAHFFSVYVNVFHVLSIKQTIFYYFRVNKLFSIISVLETFTKYN
jgi:hypothetical protein